MGGQFLSKLTLHFAISETQIGQKIRRRKKKEETGEPYQLLDD